MTASTNISFENKGAAYTLGNQGDKLIFVLHGYGQLAKYFIQKFDKIVELGYNVVAPEGLHRFYLKGNSGRVGASWMTKENRELDIANYISYLNEVYRQVKKQKKWNKIVVLGFSQGVATAFRWVADGQIKPNQLLICSGMIPPDVNLEENSAVFDSIDMTYFTGKQDPFRTEEAVVSFQARLKSFNHPIEVIEFDGVHEVNVDEVLKFL